MPYKSKIEYRRKRVIRSRFSKRLEKINNHGKKVSFKNFFSSKNKFKDKIKKILGLMFAFGFVGIFIALIFAFSVVSKYSSELPEADSPFERTQFLTSYVYDRNGKELYKIHGDQNRDIIKIEDVPLQVRWAFLAAEDADFYSHKGIDLIAILRCAIKNLNSKGLSGCGGSTITQQMIRNTVLTKERSYERKIKEAILSLRVEQKYSKDEVLQIYLNEIGFGGNVYGIETASRIYFGKEAKNLTLAEAALLAGLPQAPGQYSPLYASNIERARQLAKQRQIYVLDQISSKMSKINGAARKYNNWTSEKDLFSSEDIENAKKQDLIYQTGRINIEAPHFVFYVEDELQIGSYNNGRPFTLAEIERGGLKITTSLDLDMQHIAEETLKQGVANYAVKLGANNGALVTTDPKTGQILAMVGSADYWAPPQPEGCTLGLNCKFEPKVNVSLSLRQPGSSLKPLLYMHTFEKGLLAPASILPDIPITFSNNYKPKNNEGGFLSPPWTVRRMLFESRNIPAVQAIEILGVTNFLNALETYGYTSFKDHPERFGPAVALGAGEVSLLQHTTAYNILASQGIYHMPSPILKVVDKDGKVLYDYDKDEERKNGKIVADAGACYLINDILRNYRLTKIPSGYEFAGKTGTSDSNKNVYYMGYSPELVTGIWNGNNDNSELSRAAFGVSISKNIWQDYMYKVITKYPNSKFQRPGNVITASVCADSGFLPNNGCPTTSDLFLKDKLPPKDEFHKIYRVCSDQPDRLARAIDEQMGFAVDRSIFYFVAPKKEWQQFYDFSINGGVVIPTESCTINRNPANNNSSDPWVVISKPTSGTIIGADKKLEIDVRAFSSVTDIAKIEIFIDNILITQASSNPFSTTITISSSFAKGNHVFTAKAYDAHGKTASSSVTISVEGDLATIISPISNQNFAIGSTISVSVRHSGTGLISSALLIVDGPSKKNINLTYANGFATGSFTVDKIGEYTLKAALYVSSNETIYSQIVKIKAI